MRGGEIVGQIAHASGVTDRRPRMDAPQRMDGDDASAGADDELDCFYGLEKSVWVLLDGAGLSHHVPAFVGAGIKMATMMEWTGRQLRQELFNLGLSPDEAQSVQTAILKAEALADAFAASRPHAE